MPTSTIPGVTKPVMISRRIAYGVVETNIAPWVAMPAIMPERSAPNQAIGSSTRRSPSRTSSESSTAVLASMPTWLANQCTAAVASPTTARTASQVFVAAASPENRARSSGTSSRNATPWSTAVATMNASSIAIRRRARGEQ